MFNKYCRAGQATELVWTLREELYVLPLSGFEPSA